jgi:hypothetical protein
MDKFNDLSHPNDTWKAAKQLTKPKSSQVLHLKVDDVVVEEESMVANTVTPSMTSSWKRSKN